jgi:hypothetical protein
MMDLKIANRFEDIKKIAIFAQIKNEQLFEPSFNLDLKTININLAEETKTVEEHKNIEETDYKKMTINKLRTIVSEKGLSSDPSKLKKPEILKMLGIE